MAKGEPSPSIPVDQCLKLVDANKTTCPAQTTTQASSPNFDALAASLSAQANAFSFGALLLGFLGLLGAIGWGIIVKVWAERMARAEAKECADKMIARWLAEEAPGIIRQHVENLNNASLGSQDDAEAADEMGKEAG